MLSEIMIDDKGSLRCVISSSALDYDTLKQVFQSAKVNKANQLKTRTRATPAYQFAGKYSHD